MPFLKIAATRANFHFDGNLEFFRLLLKIVLRPSIAEFPATTRSLARIPSGPAAFLGLSLFRSLASLSLSSRLTAVELESRPSKTNLDGFWRHYYHWSKRGVKKSKFYGLHGRFGHRSSFPEQLKQSKIDFKLSFPFNFVNT